MNNKYRFFLINNIWVILLAFGAVSVSAQVMRRKDVPIQQIPAPSSVPSINQTIKNLSSVRGTIRWHKMFGLPPTGPATGEASPLPCGLMFVFVLKNIGEPGNFQKQEHIATSWDQVKMTNFLKAEENGDYYVCPYSISGLPRDANLTIVARFNDPAYETVPWIGSTIAQPLPDNARVFKGSQSVRFTDAQPDAAVHFKMEYVRTTPR